MGPMCILDVSFMFSVWIPCVFHVYTICVLRIYMCVSHLYTLYFPCRSPVFPVRYSWFVSDDVGNYIGHLSVRVGGGRIGWLLLKGETQLCFWMCDLSLSAWSSWWCLVAGIGDQGQWWWFDWQAQKMHAGWLMRMSVPGLEKLVSSVLESHVKVSTWIPVTWC